MNLLPVTEAELHAYVDGLLPPARRAEIDTYLTLRPAETERLRAYAHQNSALRALFDPVLGEAAPARLSAPPRWPQHLSRYAAAVLIAVAGAGAGWALRGAMPDDAALARAPTARGWSDELAHHAAIAHAVYSPERRHPVEVDAGQEAHLVAWLSKRLGQPVHPPRLAKLGYELIGGRLLPGNSGPVAQFMYQDASGRRLTLYLATGQADQRDTRFRFAREGTVNVFYWIDGQFGYALSAAIDKAELAKIATLVYQQLQPAS